MDNILKKTEELYKKACDFKDKARISTDNLESYIDAAKYFDEAVRNNIKYQKDSKIDADLKYQIKVHTLYYKYEKHECLASYFFEKRKTEKAKEQLKKSINFLDNAIGLIENIPETLSFDVKKHLTGFLQKNKYYKKISESKILSCDARAAWDNNCWINALDNFRRAASNFGEIVQESKSFEPECERIALGNYFGLMMNISQTMVKISLKELTKETAKDLMHHLYKAYHLGLLAYNSNPEWKQYKLASQKCYNNILNFLDINKSFWFDIYIEFENEPNFLKIMKKANINLYKKIELKRFSESKVTKISSAKSKENKMKIIDLPSNKNIWLDIQKEFDISTRQFGKKINFIKDKFIRNIIFRDIAHAYFLSKNGFSKPAVILAGGVIEELLRQYLKHKNFPTSKKTFEEYIKVCADKELLKSAISELSNFVRRFRNLVHLRQEKDKKYSISKTTAIGAVSSIFTISNDFD